MNRAELTWGNSVSGDATDGGAATSTSRRLVTVHEEYSRAWLIRAIIRFSRNINAGAGDVCALVARVSEGVGQTAFPWEFGITGVDGSDQAPIVDGVAIPQVWAMVSLPVCGSDFTIDGEIQLQAGAGAGDIRGTASVWISPMAPVYPPGLGT